ncbi:E9 [Psittacus erithacus papillomavirus 1]|uniref:E9 n=2 Tax=Psittacus erithacus timneh papillomavirus TaxID=197772 RepID=Q8JJG2_PEPVA|nr:E9 [Psittacus erithacus papillomavirus 1]AAM46853.1 E9 [Psittacus erithacus papillomavirus 1]AAM75201.1 putative X-ORF protein [Thetapapillomavirus 1]
METTNPTISAMCNCCTPSDHKTLRLYLSEWQDIIPVSDEEHGPPTVRAISFDASTADMETQRKLCKYCLIVLLKRLGSILRLGILIDPIKILRRDAQGQGPRTPHGLLPRRCTFLLNLRIRLEEILLPELPLDRLILMVDLQDVSHLYRLLSPTVDETYLQVGHIMERMEHACRRRMKRHQKRGRLKDRNYFNAA